MKQLTKIKLKQIIREELNESTLYNRASGIVNIKDITAFVKSGKNIKHEMEVDGFYRGDVWKYLQELIKKRII